MFLFYVYFWLRENGTPYYVGKGKNNRAFDKNTHAIKCPPKHRILLTYCESEQEAFEAECFFILYFGRLDLGTGCLRNLTDGGEGSSGHIASEEHRKNMSLALKGKPKSEEWKRKIAISNTGQIRSEETKLKLRETHLGQPAYWKGKTFPEKFKQKLSDVHTVYPVKGGEAWCSYRKHYTKIENFKKHPTSRRGIQGYCEECMREYHKIRNSKAKLSACDNLLPS